MTEPFSYPDEPHLRRHGPQGYARYDSYRPWLRDEFSFRCVFCLHREHWVTGGFHVDHLVPTSIQPDWATVYDNLIFTCSTCNSSKRDLEVPDPTANLVDRAIQVSADGAIKGHTPGAIRIVRLLGLDSPSYREFRRLWIGIAVMAATFEPELVQEIMGYPGDLPNLPRLRPPGGNSRPEGAIECHFARRAAGNLPPTC